MPWAYECFDTWLRHCRDRSSLSRIVEIVRVLSLMTDSLLRLSKWPRAPFPTYLHRRHRAFRQEWSPGICHYSRRPIIKNKGIFVRDGAWRNLVASRHVDGERNCQRLVYCPQEYPNPRVLIALANIPRTQELEA